MEGHERCGTCKDFNEGNCYKTGSLKNVEKNTRACPKYDIDMWAVRIENTRWLLQGGGYD